MWKGWFLVAAFALFGLTVPVQAQPGKGKGPEAELKKLELELKKLNGQLAELQEEIKKLKGPSGFGKIEIEIKNGEFKKFFEGKKGDKDWEKRKEEFKKLFEGKEWKGFGPGFGPGGKKPGFGKPGEFPKFGPGSEKPGAGKSPTTDELLRQILLELKQLRKEMKKQ
jgi:hypothetical protein